MVGKQWIVGGVGDKTDNYRTPTGVIDHATCTDYFLYRPKLVNNSFCGCELFTCTVALQSKYYNYQLNMWVVVR